MTVLFYGDPHGDWGPLFDAVEQHDPEAVVLLGDMDLDQRLDIKLSPMLDAGIDVRWIAGNHDGDDTAWHDRLFHADRGLDKCDVNGRVEVVGGMRIAGLGGVFRGKVWNPNVHSKPDPARYTREDYVRFITQAARWRRGVPMKHRVSIFPEDFDALRKASEELGGVDILVCHEAPTTHKNGFAAIDRLAHDIDARLVIHGHHHYAYEGKMSNGVRVRGLARAEAWLLNSGMLTSRRK